MFSEKSFWHKLPTRHFCSGTMLILLYACPVASTPVAPVVERAAYRNSPLGISLDEWKALAFPGEIKTGDVTLPICTNLPNLPMRFSVSWTLTLSPAEKEMGVVACSYWTDTAYKGAFGMKQIMTGQAYIPIGKTYVMPTPSYKFFDGKLYGINGVTRIEALADVVDGLTARYGQPTSSVDGEVQNKAGSYFKSKDLTWDLGRDIISVHAPGAGRIDQMEVKYIDKEVAHKLADENEKIDPSANKM